MKSKLVFIFVLQRLSRPPYVPLVSFVVVAAPFALMTVKFVMCIPIALTEMTKRNAVSTRGVHVIRRSRNSLVCPSVFSLLYVLEKLVAYWILVYQYELNFCFQLLKWSDKAVKPPKLYDVEILTVHLCTIGCQTTVANGQAPDYRSSHDVPPWVLFS